MILVPEKIREREREREVRVGFLFLWKKRMGTRKGGSI